MRLSSKLHSLSVSLSSAPSKISLSYKVSTLIDDKLDYSDKMISNIVKSQKI